MQCLDAGDAGEKKLARGPVIFLKSLTAATVEHHEHKNKDGLCRESRAIKGSLLYA